MGKLGISIYVEKSSIEEIIDYIDKAYKSGFSRIFSCLLSVDKAADSVKEIKEKMKYVNDYAHKKNFEIIVDVSPSVFDDLGISYNDLTFFKEIGADGIRLDIGYSGIEESIMTFNPHNLKIEINMSMDTSYIDTIMDFMPNKNNLIACHNFYPHRYSGLSTEFFKSTTNRFTKYGLRAATFITSTNTGTFGPWPVTDGLATLEIHRDMKISAQAKHFIAMNTMDDIIISNCYPTDDELASLAKISRDLVNFDIEIHKDIPVIEKSILLDELHYNRGDKSVNMIRSTQSRVKHKGHNFKLFNAPENIKKGDIIIESSEYGHYAGELQIALTDMKNSGKSNVVAKIVDEEIFILDEIKAWQKFRLTSS